MIFLFAFGGICFFSLEDNILRTAILAVLLKIAILDAEPIIPNRHAMRRSCLDATDPVDPAYIDYILGCPQEV